MSLERVWALWLLPLVPAVAYLLWRLRISRTAVVPSLLLWGSAEESGKGRKFFFDWRVVCSALAMGMMVIAYASPRFVRTAEERWVVALDATASMSTALGGETRLSRALRIASKKLRGKVSVLCEPRGYIEEITDFSFTPSHLDSLVARASDAPGNVERLLRRAFALAQNRAGVVLLSDREPEVRELSLILVGSESGNVGIVGFGIEGGEAFLTVKNFSPIRRSVSIRGEGKEKRVSVGAGQAVVVRMPVRGSVMQFALESNSDDFRTDNYVYAVLRPRKLTFSLRGVESPFLLKALLSAGCELSVGRADIVVSRNAEGALMNIILPGGTKWREGGELVGRGAEFRGALVKRVLQTETDGWETVLRAGRSPAIVQRRTLRGREMKILFRLDETEWSRMPSFPIFWADVARSLREEAGKEGSWRRAGKPVELRRAEEVRFPDGRSKKLRNFIPWFCGIYQVGDWRLAVNLLDESESDNRGVERILLREPVRGESMMDLSPLCTGLAILLMILSLI